MTVACVTCMRLTDTPRDAAPGLWLCDPHLHSLTADLTAIPDLHRRAADGHGDPTPANDPASATLPAGPVRARSTQPRVTGTGEQPIPIPVGLVDLLGPPDTRTVTDPHHDQTGHPSAAAILRGWAIALRADLYPDHSDPKPTVAASAQWLHLRLDVIAQYHEVGDMAREIHDVAQRLRRAVGETDDRPEYLAGVPCPRCDQLTLHRQPGSPDAQCAEPDCQTVLRPDEYRAYVTRRAATEAAEHAA